MNEIIREKLEEIKQEIWIEMTSQTVSKFTTPDDCKYFRQGMQKALDIIDTYE